eukprot:CAMPEP_0172361866 /NCGR_PEP_ID=MMETSP1060-20121228/5629_1 /TAXON_ID=37318 /ORGANISM="Pseudo-nitzschia pungens, Strain cf. cingulata" /LENGTH=446 /DNA_ID=CAMNT_0013084251 /DNA_START=140 /DNA_END=1477 /DNA_ORIENTATION=+
MANMIQNNEFTVGSKLRTNSTSPVNNARHEAVDTPTMDFDDWPVDSFSVTKEMDVFSVFGGVEEDVHHTNSQSVPFPPPSSHVASISHRNASPAYDSLPIDKNATNHQSRKRTHHRQSSGKVGNSNGETTLDTSKNDSSTKKKSECLPISRRKKKPKGMPKRPLSAYNLYFQAERTKIIANQQENNGPRIGFEGLGKIIGKKWRDLSNADKKGYEKLAEKDSERYRKEMDAYQEKKAKKYEEEDKRAASQIPVFSSIASSTTSNQDSTFDMRFPKGPRSVQVVAIGERVGNSVVLTHPPESMVSSVSLLPPGSTSISYPARPPRHALQHNSFFEALNPLASGGTVRAPAPPDFFPRPAADGNTEAQRYSADRRDDNCPMPPGMEVILADRNGIDRKYRVQYTCYSMTRENANRYIDSLTGVRNFNSTASPSPGVGAIGPNREYGQW